MSHAYSLDCVEFYLTHVLTKFLIVGLAVYYLGQLFYSALKSTDGAKPHIRQDFKTNAAKLKVK